MTKKPKNEKNILFVCAHNQTRSVAGEGLLKGEKGYKVQSRALWQGTPRKLTKQDGKWADEVYVMMPEQIRDAVEIGVPPEKVKALFVPDIYEFCEKDLLLSIKSQLEQFGIFTKKSLRKAQNDCWKVTEKKLGWGKKDWKWIYPSREAVYPEYPKFFESTGTFYDIPSAEIPAPKRLREPEGRVEGYYPLWHLREGEAKKETVRRLEKELVEERRETKQRRDQVLERARELYKMWESVPRGGVVPKKRGKKKKHYKQRRLSKSEEWIGRLFG